MALLSSKWILIPLIIVVVLVVLLLLGRKSVRTQITIQASPEEVWAVLTDVPRIGEWNNVLIPVKGELEEGSKVTYEFYQDEGGTAAVMDAKVRCLTPSELINQAGGMPGILTFDHSYRLSGDGDSTTVEIFEEYRGVMVPFWNPHPVEKAYERLLSLLRERVLHLKNDGSQSRP